MNLPPLSLYLHLPWCIRKCPYCDFNSHRAGDNAPRDRYVTALIKDIILESESGRAAGREISTVFIGGGTPSLFSGEEIEEILEAVRSYMRLASDAEITMEANPGTVERGNVAGYRAAGVNRLSLGAQSFSADSLQKLGRIHGPDEISGAYQAARDAGFDNINLDIMFALPGQDVDGALYDLRQAVALQPEHLSWYQLTLEPNTVFYQRPPEGIPDDDASWDIQQAGHAFLAEAGYAQYEVSAFARPGKACRHNMNYWTFGDYLAVGAGAHGKFTSGDGAITRYRKSAHPLTYIDEGERGEFEEHLEPLAQDDIAFEYMLNVLRLAEGFSESDFAESTGLGAGVLQKRLHLARDDGLLACTDVGNWRPTEKGRLFLNDLQGRFLP